MAIVGQLTGPPGSGKTTSLEDMVSKEVVYIDCDRNGLS